MCKHLILLTPKFQFDNGVKKVTLSGSNYFFSLNTFTGIRVSKIEIGTPSLKNEFVRAAA
jgi:hypothetical protein